MVAITTAVFNSYVRAQLASVLGMIDFNMSNLRQYLASLSNETSL